MNLNHDSQDQCHLVGWPRLVISAFPSVIRTLHLLLGVTEDQTSQRAGWGKAERGDFRGDDALRSLSRPSQHSVREKVKAGHGPVAQLVCLNSSSIPAGSEPKHHKSAAWCSHRSGGRNVRSSRSSLATWQVPGRLGLKELINGGKGESEEEDWPGVLWKVETPYSGLKPEPSDAS